MTTPETGHPLLQALIDSISVFEGAACWDFAAMYAVRDALAAQAAPAQPLVNDTFAVDWLTNRAELHPLTANLVIRFARALAAKLAAAEMKYGYTDGWCDSNWMDECRAKLVEHIAKGDPRDVAAYCAFLWHHGESTAAAQAAPAAQPVSPTAWMWQHPETGHTGFVENCTDEDRQQWERVNRPRVFICPLYASPQAAEQHTKSQLKRIAAQKGEKPLRAASPQADTQPEEKPE